MARVEIAVYKPELFVAGRTATVVVRLHAIAETMIDRVELELVEQRDEHASRTLWSANAVGMVRLPVGLTSYAVEVPIPETTSPSFWHPPFTVRHDLRVRVVIPWRFDPVIEVPVTIRRPGERGDLETRPQREFGARIAIATVGSSFVPGTSIDGALTMYGDDRPLRVEVALVPRIGARDGMPRTKIFVDVGAMQRRAGFSLPIAEDTAPTHAGHGYELAWHVVASYLVDGPRDLLGLVTNSPTATSIPVRLVAAEPAETHTRLRDTVELPVVDAKIRALFEDYAEHQAWELPDPRHALLERDHQGCRLSLAYQARELDGAFVARIDYPRVGLKLVLRGTVRPDGLEPDRAYVARDFAQAKPFVDAVAVELTEISLVRIAAWTDTMITIEQAVGSVDREKLARFARTMVRVAEAIVRVSRSIEPAIATANVYAWHALATDLEGAFVPGDMALIGKLGGAHVQCALGYRAWSPPMMTITVGDGTGANETVRRLDVAVARPRHAAGGDLPPVPPPAPPAPERPIPTHALGVIGFGDTTAIAEARPVPPPPPPPPPTPTEIDLADGRALATLAVHEPAAIPMIAAWSDELANLRIHDGTIRVELPATDNCERVRAIMHDLRALLARIDRMEGPYR